MGNKFFDEMGIKVNEQRSNVRNYGDPDVIWEDSQTRGKVYVGNISAASELATLRKFGIRYVINCQGMDTKNYFEHMKDFTYLRFPIGASYWSPFNMKSDEGVIRYFNVCFSFIESIVSKGESVLIHCLAGAHRAGTTGTAWLMYAEDLGVK